MQAFVKHCKFRELLFINEYMSSLVDTYTRNGRKGLLSLGTKTHWNFELNLYFKLILLLLQDRDQHVFLIIIKRKEGIDRIKFDKNFHISLLFQKEVCL